MAQRDRAAVDIELGGIGIEVLEPCQRDRGKGFVHLVQVDVVDRHARALERTLGGEQRFFEHDYRIPGRDGQIVNPRQRGEAVVLQRLLADHQHRARPVADLAAAGRGDLAFGAEQLDAGDTFQRRVEANAFIDSVAFLAFGGFDLDADDFGLEGARLGRLDRLLVARQRKAVEVVLREAVLLRDHFRAHELAPLDAGIFLLEAGRLIIA